MTKSITTAMRIALAQMNPTVGDIAGNIAKARRAHAEATAPWAHGDVDPREAQELLARRNVAVRVVSMPSTTTFDRQSAAYKVSVLEPGAPRVAVEMGVTDGWWKYGCAGVVGIDSYGESAPASVLFKHFGFTPENVANTVRTVLAH